MDLTGTIVDNPISWILIIIVALIIGITGIVAYLIWRKRTNYKAGGFLTLKCRNRFVGYNVTKQ
jgi:hypothetical protein